MEKEFYEYELDGKRLCFHKSNTILVQIGKGKSSYKTRYQFLPQNFGQAILYYNGLNVGMGFKKRLICPNFKRSTLTRSIT